MASLSPLQKEDGLVCYFCWSPQDSLFLKPCKSSGAETSCWAYWPAFPSFVWWCWPEPLWSVQLFSFLLGLPYTPEGVDLLRDTASGLYLMTEPQDCYCPENEVWGKGGDCLCPKGMTLRCNLWLEGCSCPPYLGLQEGLCRSKSVGVVRTMDPLPPCPLGNELCPWGCMTGAVVVLPYTQGLGLSLAHVRGAQYELSVPSLFSSPSVFAAEVELSAWMLACGQIEDVNSCPSEWPNFSSLCFSFLVLN